MPTHNMGGLTGLNFYDKFTNIDNSESKRIENIEIGDKFFVDLAKEKKISITINDIEFLNLTRGDPNSINEINSYYRLKKSMIKVYLISFKFNDVS